MGGVDVGSRFEDDVTKIKKMAEQNRFDDAVKAHNMDPIRHQFD